MGRTGFYTVFSLAFTEFFGDSLIVLIIMWQLLMELLPEQGASPFFDPPLLLCLSTQACALWAPLADI